LFWRCENGEKSFWTGKSVKDKQFPFQKSFVRGTNHTCGYAVAESASDKNKTYVECYLNTDIGGLLPQTLVESALPGQQLKYLEGVIAEVKKRQKHSR